MSLWPRILARLGIATRTDLAVMEQKVSYDFQATQSHGDRQIAVLRRAIIKTAIHTPASNDVRGIILHPDRFEGNDHVRKF